MPLNSVSSSAGRRANVSSRAAGHGGASDPLRRIALLNAKAPLCGAFGAVGDGAVTVIVGG